MSGMSGYGYIEEIIVMRPEDYDLWKLSGTNVYVTDDARSDIIEHYGIERYGLYSLYEMTHILTRDRNFAELRGIDMDSKEATVRGLAYAGFLSREGIWKRGLDFNVDLCTTPSGKPMMVLSIYEES